MIKVCYIYRHKAPNGRPSIENVFQTISKHIPGDQVSIEEFNCDKNLFKTVRKLRKVKADIYHITGPNNFIAFFIPFRKKMMTIHDVYHWRFDLKGLRKFIFGLVYYYFPPRLCSAVTAISEEVRQDLVKYFGINEKNIRTIQNPLSHTIPYQEKEFHKDKPVILQIGYSPHKNLANLVEAVKGISCRLEIVGQPSTVLIDKMNRYGIEYQIQSNLSHEELEQKYIQADIVFFASLYEGFGLPLLEAQSAGRPLIASNISPMKEIAGRGALLVDPLNPIEIRDAIIKINDDAALRNNLITAGFENVKLYDPITIAYQYVSIYKQLVNEKSGFLSKKPAFKKKGVEIIQ